MHHVPAKLTIRNSVEVLKFSEITEAAAFTWETLVAQQQAVIGSGIDVLRKGYASKRSTAGSVNIRDNIRLNCEPIHLPNPPSINRFRKWIPPEHIIQRRAAP